MHLPSSSHDNASKTEMSTKIIKAVLAMFTERERERDQDWRQRRQGQYPKQKHHRSAKRSQTLQEGKQRNRNTHTHTPQAAEGRRRRGTRKRTGLTMTAIRIAATTTRRLTRKTARMFVFCRRHDHLVVSFEDSYECSCVAINCILVGHNDGWQHEQRRR